MCSPCKFTANIADVGGVGRELDGASTPADVPESDRRARLLSLPSLRHDAVYGKYFAMLEKGVPAAKVKEKMRVGPGCERATLCRRRGRWHQLAATGRQ